MGWQSTRLQTKFIANPINSNSSARAPRQDNKGDLIDYECTVYASAIVAVFCTHTHTRVSNQLKVEFNARLIVLPISKTNRNSSSLPLSMLRMHTAVIPISCRVPMLCALCSSRSAQHKASSHKKLLGVKMFVILAFVSFPLFFDLIN